MKDGAPVGTRIAGRYEIKAEIGRGGMGVVYEVEHLNTGERLALKVLTSAASLHAQTVARFKREARASAQIKSEHVVRVTDADAAPELDGAPFLVMELLNGTDLEQHVKKNGPMAPAMVLTVLGQIGTALHAAHQLGIVHRDVKPENLFLHRRPDGVVVAKVLDFGISKFGAEVGATTTGALVGTPLYMAPEQAHSENDRISPATDVWALGLVTLRLLTGEHFWGSPSIGELITKIVVSPISKPSERWAGNPLMTPELDAWFARSCEREPEKRWASVEDQMQSLRDVLEGAAVGPAQTRSSASIATSLDKMPVAASARLQRPRGRLVLVGLAAIAAVVLGASRGHWHASPPTEAKGNADAAVESSVLLIEDLPASPTKSEDARNEFRDAMRAWAEGTKPAVPMLDDAIAKDPAFGSANLQRAYVGFTMASELDAPAREAFRRAVSSRSSLGPRDRAFLDAIAPAFLDPPDFREAAAKLTTFVVARPGDVQGHEALGIELTKSGRRAEALTEYRAVLALAPGSGLASIISAQYLLGRGDQDGGMRLLDECIRLRPMDIECSWQRASWLSSQGRCEEADALARQMLVIEPKNAWLLILRAKTAASSGAPLDAVAALLAQRREQASAGGQEEESEGDDAFALAARAGDFHSALEALDRAEAVATTVSQTLHRRAYLRAALLWEMGEPNRSADVAMKFLDHSRARLRPERTSWDATGPLLNFAHAGGRLDDSALAVRRSEWIREWRERDRDSGLLWVGAYSSPTLLSPAEATYAIHEEELDDEGPISLGSAADPSANVSRCTYAGALFLAAGRLDDAEKQLTTAARVCVLVPEVRALHLLGVTYARKGDNSRACSTFAEVEALWGHAKPRSITAEAARAEAKKLGCR